MVPELSNYPLHVKDFLPQRMQRHKLQPTWPPDPPTFAKDLHIGHPSVRLALNNVWKDSLPQMYFLFNLLFDCSHLWNVEYGNFDVTLIQISPI